MPALTQNTVRVELLIDGAHQSRDERFDVRDPGRTSDLVATVATASPADVDAAVRAAGRAQPSWGSLGPAKRLAVLEAAVVPVEAAIEQLAPQLTRENGGTLFESRMDLTRGMELFRDFLRRAPDLLAAQTVDTETHWLRRERHPVGVCALIVPWNSPVVLTMSKVAPALAAGNTVVVKPSILAPVVLAAVLEQLAEQLPPGVINVVHGDAPVGDALVRHPEVRKVSFTGSVRVGKQIMAAASDTVKRVSLELGGNDPAILLPDVELDACAPLLARGAFTRAGQVCFAVKRIYAPRSRYEECVEALVAEADGFLVGHGLDPDTTFGPLISAEAKARVQALITRADAAGATVHRVGSFTADADPDGGHYLLPAVVSGIGHDAELVGVEQFGPVVPVIAYDDVEEAISLANDSEFGLCSSVWGTDTDRAIAVAGRLQTGGTFINSHNISSLSFDMPLGGVKESGIGRERTELGLQEYVEEHAIRLAH
jgi:acyl-CoA reductase-like NAD-dependent aldehyde dehydrogenase